MIPRIRIIKNEDPTCIRIGIDSSLFSVLSYSVIAFLKNHISLRRAVGVVGVLALLVGIFFNNLHKINAISATPSDTVIDTLFLWSGLSFALIVVGGTLSMVFFLSSSFFQFVLENDRPAIAVGETEKAEKAYEEDNKDPFAYLELDAKKLSEYYIINQRQARTSYNMAIFAMVLGLIVILFGGWYVYKGIAENKPTQTLTSSLSTISGIIMNVVSILFIRFHNHAQQRSLIYFNQLIRNQQLGLSVRLALSMEDDKLIDAKKEKIIDRLLNMFKNESGKIFIDNMSEAEDGKRERAPRKGAKKESTKKLPNSTPLVSETI